MFLGFLVFLRGGGIKVSLHDWLSLMEGPKYGSARTVMQGLLCTEQSASC